MSARTDAIIEGVIGREGRYSNNPNDAGGETMWGITVGTARKYGYTGQMSLMPREVAKRIYEERYIHGPGFDQVLAIQPDIANELIDTGVNMGQPVASMFLQKALNALNDQGRLYNDIIEDGDIGTASLNALRAYLRARPGSEGVRVMLVALNVQQGARYLELAAKRQKNEAFVYGWLRTRTVL